MEYGTMRKAKLKIAALALDTMKQRWILFRYRTYGYNVAFNAWLSFTAATHISKRPHKELDAQRLPIRYVYGQAPATTARRACNDWELRKADDT